MVVERIPASRPMQLRVHRDHLHRRSRTSRDHASSSATCIDIASCCTRDVECCASFADPNWHTRSDATRVTRRLEGPATKTHPKRHPA